MSEANAPFDRPNPAEAEVASDWENPFAALVAEADWEDSAENQLFEQEVPQTKDQPASDRVDLAEADSAAPRPAMPNPMAAIAAWSENAANSTESTDITDLISLIQELNQCNSILLDRVSQLEEALESSQVALQAEVGRSQDFQSQDFQSIASQVSADLTPEDLPSAQEQITSLFNQLEFSHQTQQRQQILIETLTGQLEASQERVAQLEREAALLQQHYSDRLQLLAQAEGANRDLQARLHRQQRYTLQFKVALEKCLEVPAPQYDLGAMSSAIEDPSFLPKAQRIQPWAAADEIATPRAVWMKLHSFGLEEIETASTEAAPLEPVNQSTEANLRLPVLQLPITEQKVPNAAAIAPEPVSYDLAAKPIAPEPAILSEPALMQKIEVAMQPLAVQLAEAMQAERELPAKLSVEPPIELSAELPVEPVAEPAAPQLVAPDADAEDDLWQDLARLIEVSTEDVVKASLSGDFTAFEAIDFEAIQSQSAESLLAQPEAAPPEAISQPSPNPPDLQPDPPSDSQADSFIPALTHSSWPSPVIHPLRPAKKQRSPGAIDLPCFARQDANPGMA